MTTLLTFNLVAQCDELVAEGAVLGKTPAEVVQACDITFAMLADPAAAEAVRLQPVLQQPCLHALHATATLIDPAYTTSCSRTQTALVTAEPVTCADYRHAQHLSPSSISSTTAVLHPITHLLS